MPWATSAGRVSLPDLVQKQQPYKASKDPGENLRKAHGYVLPWALCSHHKTSHLSHAGLTNPVQDAGDTQRCCCSVTKLCPTLHDPMDCSMPGSPVLRHLPEFAQIHGHWVSDAISSSVLLFSFCLQSFPASGSFPMSWFFASGGQNIGASVSVLSSEYSGVISFRTDLFAVQGTFKSLLQHDSSKVLALII